MALSISIGLGLDNNRTGDGSASIDSVTFTDNNDGTPATLDITYTGDVTGYRVYIATGGASISVNAAQLYAGSGGTDTDEFTDFAIGSSIDITGLTSASDSSVRISACLIKSANGADPSNVVTETVSGLDFTVPAAPTAATNVAGTTVTLTFAETIYGSQDLGDWVVSGVAAGTPTIVSVTGFSTSSLVVTIGTNLPVNGDTVTLAYTNTDSDLRDADGNNLADFTGLAVTNNVPGSFDIFSETNTRIGWDLTELYTTTVRTTEAVNDGDAVVVVTDAKGVNDGIVVGGGTLRISGGKRHIELAAGAYIESESDLTGMGATDVIGFAADFVDDAVGIPITSDSVIGDGWLFYYTDGGGASCFNGFGTPTLRHNGAAAGGTTLNDVYDELVNNGLAVGFCYALAQSVSLTAFNSAHKFRFFGYTGGAAWGCAAATKFYGCFIASPTSFNQSSTETQLAGLE